MGHVSVYLLHGGEMSQDAFIAPVFFSAEGHFLIVLPSAVAERRPVVSRVIDDGLWDSSLDDVFQYLVNHFLLFVGMWQIGIVGLDFITQVPMREEDHVFGEELLAFFGEQMAHHDVVAGNVVLGIGIGLSGLFGKVGRHTRSEHVAHACVSPFLTVPSVTQAVLFIEGVVREVQDGHERHFVFVEVIPHV